MWLAAWIDIPPEHASALPGNLALDTLTLGEDSYTQAQAHFSYQIN